MTRTVDEDVELLLPWFAAGTLSTEEAARVAEALAKDPVLRDRLLLVMDELEADREDHAAISLPRSLTADRLLQVGGIRPADTDTAWSRLRNGVAALWSGPARAVVAALVLLVVGQSVFTGALLIERQGGPFHLASGQQRPQGTMVLVRFTSTATMHDITSALQPLDFTIVDGPRADGFYTLHVGPDTLSTAERQQVLDRLNAMKPIIALALRSN